MRMQIVRNFLWLVLGRGLQVVFGIVSIGMIARAIGPESFAAFQYAQSLVLIASSVALICGAEVVVPRLVGDRAPAAQHRLLVHVFALRGAAAIAGYLIVMAVLALTEDDKVIVLTAVIFGIPILFYEPFGTVRAWLSGSRQSGHCTWRDPARCRLSRGCSSARP
ncbi:hypothetical protein CTP10_R65940 (plasmid) [Cupriavidus sp. P-10]|uniref:lipopolysaccharide biosynthesis protein n=1 Tax=Cupriavidus sp. P-10 TaxID=2027911 RepID=UPI000EDC1F64|nr:hypothetical protein [Cupriavidus sp. P-10]BDB29181.1 hypothetical protein CTP10_R65940 [Cupriavidus sp. P-10]